MVTNDVSFILSFVILMTKMWIFGFSLGVCPTESSNLVFSPECLVSNRRRALPGGIRLGGSATRANSLSFDTNGTDKSWNCRNGTQNFRAQPQKFCGQT